MSAITRKQIIEDEAIRWGEEYVKNLQPAVDKNKEFIASILALNEANNQLRNSQNNKQFFRTKEEILLLHEETTLLSDIKQFFYRHYSQPGDEGSLSLESLREIAKILSINYIQPIHLNAKEEANV